MARKMRDSGVEWIGEVPEGWEVNRLQWHLEEVVEKNDPIQTTNILSLTNDRGVIPYEDKGNVGNKAKENYTEYKLAYKNTIVANSMNVLIGSVGLSKYDGCVSPVYYIYKSKDSNSIRYYNYLFQLTPFQKELRRYANGILEIRLRVSSSDILKRSVPAPSFSEQRRIADYLDEKCAAIDGAVCELKRGIEDCKAWKKAIIFEAVTGKANVLAASACAKATADKKNAKVAKRQMRDSGIPWIGEIPEGWEVRRLKFIFDEITDGSHFSPEGVADGMPYVTATDIRGVGIDFTKVKRISETDYNELVNNGCKVQLGDILLVKDGATTGRVGLMVEQVDCVALSSVAMLRTKKYCNRFFMYVIFSELLQKQIMLAMAGSAMPRITISKLNEFLGVLPPLPEQQAIADYLDEKCAAIDALVAEKEKLIADLQAYKKSLIFELVTGKREVA